MNRLIGNDSEGEESSEALDPAGLQSSMQLRPEAAKIGMLAAGALAVIMLGWLIWQQRIRRRARKTANKLRTMREDAASNFWKARSP
jgi:hypothetical protein